jgi:hypothetical protein
VTSAAWERVHKQYALSRRVLEEAAEVGGDCLLQHQEEIDQVFGGLDPFLAHLQLRWHTAARCELSGGPSDADEVQERLCQSLAPLRAILDAYRDREVVRQGAAHQRAINSCERSVTALAG